MKCPKCNTEMEKVIWSLEERHGWLCRECGYEDKSGKKIVYDKAFITALDVEIGTLENLIKAFKAIQSKHRWNTITLDEAQKEKDNIYAEIKRMFCKKD
jgi:Zn ribbon nucleic-acid-binding protein